MLVQSTVDYLAEVNIGRVLPNTLHHALVCVLLYSRCHCAHALSC